LVAGSTDACSLKQSIRKFFTMDRDVFVKNIEKIKEELSWEGFAQDLIAFVNNNF